MRPSILVLIISMTVMLTAGALVGGYFAFRPDDAEVKSATNSRTANNPASNNQGQGMSLNVQKSDSISLGGGGQPQAQTLPLSGESSGSSNGGNGNSSAKQQVPGPEDFEVYEEYAKEKNALFADFKVGDGATAEPGDTLAMIYQGWLTDGTLFDQSRVNDEGKIEAYSFQLGAGKVIAGWEQGIAGMRVGGKRRLIIPSVVGYGAVKQGKIPANSMLVFDVELVQIQKQNKSKSGL